MTKILVAGSKGRMGSRISAMVRESKDLSLAAEIDAGDNLERSIEGCDVAIDFTVAQAAAKNAEIAALYRKPIVIGTTGLSDEQKLAVKKASLEIPVVFAPNMSVGVNVMLKLIEIASRALKSRCKIDIVEAHHVHKLDRPSGTAKKMLDIVTGETGLSLEEDVFFYEEETGEPDEGGDTEISVRSIRRGEVVGDHAIHFTSPGETLTITHHAATRDIFAEGALEAARWIVGKEPGLYGMGDVLELNPERS
ncbi:MAG TPA: 4-hydroxy-tetrahydrodipicolinate reductase [bacterium]|nr:4-hydroxy-tetrahydrodipicolinate reductase [bacterium]